MDEWMTWTSICRHSTNLMDGFDALTFILGTSFQRLIPEPKCFDTRSVKRLIFCSGKVYYQLTKGREEKHLDNEVAIARLEQVIL